MKLQNISNVEVEQKIQSLCSEYLMGFCDDLESSLSIQRIVGGTCNTMYLVTSKNPRVSDHGKRAPRSVLVRFFGSEFIAKDNPFKEMGEAAEDVVFYVLSKMNLGPKLLGVFPGGRIEQYCPSRRITASDFENEALNKSLAKKVASIHCLDMPVAKQPSNYFDVLIKPALEKLKSRDLNELLLTVDEEEREEASSLLFFDFTREMNWLQRILPEVRSRVVFCHNDLNPGNILVRTEETDHPDDRVVLVDIEHSRYYFRGWDIASHLGSRYIDIASFTLLEPKHPPEAHRRFFVREYIKHWRASVDETLIDDKLDTEDHVLMEIEFYTLYVHLTHSLFFLFFGEHLNPDDSQSEDSENTDKLLLFKYGKERIDLYEEQKRRLVADYPQFNWSS